MFEPIEGGSMVDVQGLFCYLPPEGYVMDYRTNRLKKIGIHKRHPFYESCWWEPDPRWKEYKKWQAEEKKQKEHNPKYKHPDLAKFIEEMWLYRMSGFWFYNNETPTYITGQNWFYLSVFKMNRGELPDYRDADREVFYAWQVSQEDPLSMGLLYITKRRCFAKGTPVLMHDGSIKSIESIGEGEQVMGDDSTPRLVSNVTSGTEMMYRIKMKKGGQYFDCNESHIIFGYEYIDYQKKPVTYTVKDFLNLSEPKQKRIRIARTGWELPHKDVPIDPYLLGLWLGDGMSRNLEIVNEDVEVIDFIKGFCAENGLKYHNYGAPTGKVEHMRHGMSCKNATEVEYNGKVYQYKTELMKDLGLHPKTPLVKHPLYRSGAIKVISRKDNSVWGEFMKLGLKNNKHIPDIFLHNSMGVRLSLLAGLIDTDGCLFKRKNGNANYVHISFGPKATKLKDNVKSLIISCGFNVRELYYEPTKATHLNIYGDIERIPTKIKRKQASYIVGDIARKDAMTSSFTVEKLGVGEYFGFEVDENNLFLLGDGTIVHNSGKSFICGCIALELTTRNIKFNAGIQSKTEDDAKDFFRKTVVTPYKTLPDFFMPDAGGEAKVKASAKELRFASPKSEDIDNELDSMITYRSSGTHAYDGTQLGFYVSDEIFKPQDTDIHKRWSVVQFCLKSHSGKIIGKTIHTSTVDAIDGSTANHHKMWSNSDQNNKIFGRTSSGMNRLFISADRVKILDKYGIPMIEESLHEILAERKAKESDRRELSELIKKEPLNIEEAFQADAQNCVFSDPIKANDRLQELIFNKEQFVTGNFEWVNGDRDTEVEFIVCPNGRWQVAYLPPENLRNMFVMRGNRRFPNNTGMFRLGVDPFDYKMEQLADKKRMSKGSGWIKKCEDPIHYSNIDFGGAAMYLSRPNDPNIFYEDILKAAFFYGTYVLFERNKSKIADYFEDRGYLAYLYWIPGEPTPGIYNSAQSKGGGTNGKIAELTDTFINHHINSIVFPEVIRQWLKFTPENTTEFDLAMAFGFAEILDREITKKISKVSSNAIKASDILSFIS